MMSKCITILLFAAFCSNEVLPQRIDSLVKVLPTLQDTARIDFLNALRVQYLFQKVIVRAIKINVAAIV